MGDRVEARQYIPAAPQTLGEHPQGRGIIQALKDYPLHLLEGMWNTVKAPGQALQSTADNPVTTENAMAPARDTALMFGFRGAGEGGGLRPRAAGEAPKPVEPTFIPDKPVEVPNLLDGRIKGIGSSARSSA